MKVLITDYNRDKKIQAIKGLRMVAYDANLKVCKDLIEGPLPAELECRKDFPMRTIFAELERHEIRVKAINDNGVILEFLSELPTSMTVGELLSTLRALSDFKMA